MKKLLLSIFLVCCAACQAQTEDVTSTYLVNADFADGTLLKNAPRGWTLDLSTTGVQSKISTGEKGGGVISGGQNHWQLWQPSGALTGRAFQNAAHLPVGRYRLTASVVSTAAGAVTLYLNDSTATVTDARNYAVETLIVSGEAEVGVRFAVQNGATVDFDDFRLLQVPMTDEDVQEVLVALHQQCVADTLKRGQRQRWYNRDEMLTAFAAYDNAVLGTSSTAPSEAIAALQDAHRHFTEITTAYTSLRTEVADLYDLTRRSQFALRDSVSAIRTGITRYYSKNEDHYAWVSEALASVRTMSDIFGQYQRLNKTISEARNQYKATDYDGRDALAAAMSAAWNVQTTAVTAEEFQHAIDAVKAAQATYLANRPEEWVTIQNGLLWKTVTGATVQAHAPGFVRVGDIWYMCGEDRSGPWNPDINLYSSTDLVHWKFERKIVENGVTTAELGHARMIERPKLLYNAHTDKYVVWCHYEAGNYGASEAACFECDSVNGPYHYVWSGRPLDVKSRDCNVFQDTDGTAYFISTTSENTNLGLFRLSDDYHEAVEHTNLFGGQRREAPAIVRIADRYFMFNSACSGWDPNRQKMSHTTDLKSGWTNLTNVGNEIAYDTQAAAILEIKGTKATTYLYVGDRWQDPDLQQTKTIIFPIAFNGTSCDFRYHERFDINFVTGEWRETPREQHFADKTGWKVIDCSSEETSAERGAAADAIDGNNATKWHSHYSGTVAAAPHYITVDMGREHTLCGFLATPRMDDSASGLIRKYKFEVSTDGQTWKTVSEGDWLLYCTETAFPTTTCRYLRLTCKEGTYCSLAELDVVLDHQAVAIEQVHVQSPTSDTTPFSTDNTRPSSTVISRLSYAPDGRFIPATVPGLHIDKVLYADGVSVTTKRLVR